MNLNPSTLLNRPCDTPATRRIRRGQPGLVEQEEEADLEGEPIEQQPVTKTYWLFNTDSEPLTKPTDLKFGRAKGYLIEALYRCVTKHDLEECFQLLKVLPEDHSVDPYVLFRFLMILIECNKTEDVSKNVIYHLDMLTTGREICKPDIFVEFLGYFIRHNRLEDAKELYIQRSRYILYRRNRHIDCVKASLKCYELFLNYQEWKDKINNAEVKPAFDLSIQGWLVNSFEILNNTKGNYEYFVSCVVEILTYYGYTKKAYLLASQFQYKNPLNIGIQLLLYNLLEYLSTTSSQPEADANLSRLTEASIETCNSNRKKDIKNMNNFSGDMNDEVYVANLYPIKNDKTSILENLRKLDISRPEIVKLHEETPDLCDLFKDYMDVLNVVAEIGNIDRWKAIKELIKQILDSNDDALLSNIRELWTSRYQKFWCGVDFVQLAGPSISTRDKKIIVRTLKLLNEKL